MDDKVATQFLEAIQTSVEPDNNPVGPRYLIVIQGGIPGSMVPITSGTLSMGRSDENELILPEPSISRRHAELKVDESGRVWIVDRLSTNGTFLNGTRLVPMVPMRVHAGNRLRLGSRVILKYACPDAEEEAFQRSMYERTVRDPLTGLFNRSYFLEQLSVLALRALGRGLGLAVVMLDIDRFKMINDTLGHAGGDAILKQVSAILRSATRVEDLVARFGGEEFAIAIPIATEDHAVERAERIRAALASRRMTFDGKKLRVTASLGVAFAQSCPIHEVDAMIAAADRALYRAKGSGRNRVTRARDGRLDTPVSVIAGER